MVAAFWALPNDVLAVLQAAQIPTAELIPTQTPPSPQAHQAIPLQMHPSAPVWIAT